MLDIGAQIPGEIELQDADGNKVKLSDFAGQYMVVYFYPEDETPGCTIEACSFRDLNDEIEKLGVKIIGISPDSVESHAKFRENHKLSFLLLSDPEKRVMEKFGVWGEKNLYGRIVIGVNRSTFIVDPTGKIVFVWRKVGILGHGNKVYNKLKQILKQ